MLGQNQGRTVEFFFFRGRLLSITPRALFIHWTGVLPLSHMHRQRWCRKQAPRLKGTAGRRHKNGEVKRLIGEGLLWEERLQETRLRWGGAVRRGHGAPPAPRPPGRMGGRCHLATPSSPPGPPSCGSQHYGALQAAGQHFCIWLSVPTLKLSFKSGTNQEKV